MERLKLGILSGVGKVHEGQALRAGRAQGRCRRTPCAVRTQEESKGVRDKVGAARKVG